jgi:peptidoglycan hydrolase CwlO-like protein
MMVKKTARKKARIQERIDELQASMTSALAKKDSAKTEINLPKVQNEIAALRKQMAELK